MLISKKLHYLIDKLFFEFLKIDRLFQEKFPIYKAKTNTLLLIRTDAIGDYILFRNFIEEIKKSGKYSNYKITLCGNIAWKEIAEKYDNKFINNFIWIDRGLFLNKFFYTVRKLFEIKKVTFETVINPIYSRDYLSETIVKMARGKHYIGHEGDNANLPKAEIQANNRYYTKLIDSKNEIIFEFKRNKMFFEELLDKKMEIEKPYFKIKKPNYNQILIFPGANDDYRKWAINNYVSIVNFIKSFSKSRIIIAGGLKEQEGAKELLNKTDAPITDLTGKTSLIELIQNIAGSKLVITNDTCALHIAVATNTPVICISNGNHYGRFSPYPKSLYSKGSFIYPPIMKNKTDDFLKKTYGKGSQLNINTITPSIIKPLIKNYIC